MATVLRAAKYNFDVAITHDFALSGSGTAGTRYCLLLGVPDAGTVVSVMAIGAAGTAVSTATPVVNYATQGATAYVYELASADAAVTGLRVTVSIGGGGGYNAHGVIAEISDTSGIGSVIAVRNGTFSATSTRVTVSPSAANDVGLGFVWRSGGGGVFTPDTNNTALDATLVAVGFYSGTLTASGAQTIGGVNASATFGYGIGVTFANASAGAVGIAALAHNANQLIEA